MEIRIKIGTMPIEVVKTTKKKKIQLFDLIMIKRKEDKNWQRVRIDIIKNNETDNPIYFGYFI